MPSELKAHTKHWTERSLDDYLYRVGSDYVRQIEHAMSRDSDATRTALAEKLGVTKGRISQVLNNPGNLTLRKMIEYARAVGQKISVVAYDDGDHDNVRGPISSEVFVGCWQTVGRPVNFFELNERRTQYFVVRSARDNGANAPYDIVWFNGSYSSYAATNSRQTDPNA